MNIPYGAQLSALLVDDSQRAGRCINNRKILIPIENLSIWMADVEKHSPSSPLYRLSAAQIGGRYGLSQFPADGKPRLAIQLALFRSQRFGVRRADDRGFPAGQFLVAVLGISMRRPCMWESQARRALPL